MPDAAGIDPRAALQALGDAHPGEITSVTGGWDAALWRVEHDGHVSALRVFRPEQRLMAEHEALVMRLAGGLAPNIRATGEWEGRPALLLEWVSGDTVAAYLRAHPRQAGHIGHLFGHTQAALHATPLGYDLNDLAGRWLQVIGPEERTLRNRLRALAGPNVLLHLDYHPLNVMTDGRRITGVLDWSNALPGDRRADLARTQSILRLMTRVPRPPRPRERIILRLFERGWWRGYCAVAGKQDDLAPFLAWAGVLMQRDLAPRIGRPDTGLTTAHMAEIRAWTERWRRTAGVEG